MATSGGSRRRRVPQISIHASPSGMRTQRASSSGGGAGGGIAGTGGNALVSFAPHGSSSSPSQFSDIDFPRGISDFMAGGESRATTAPGPDGPASVFRSRVSANFRQALSEAKERTAARRLTAQSVREQRRSNSNSQHQHQHQQHQRDSIIRLDGGARLVEEADDDFDADDVFEEEVGAAVAPPPDPDEVSDPRRRRALRRWGLLRDIVDDIHRERHAKKTEGWSMFFKHVRAMSEAEKTRQDLYDRYNIFGDSKSDFMTTMPVIPDELLIAAGVTLPSTRSRRQGLGAVTRGRGGRPPRR